MPNDVVSILLVTTLLGVASVYYRFCAEFSALEGEGFFPGDLLGDLAGDLDLMIEFGNCSLYSEITGTVLRFMKSW